jgi:predicted HTH transcriptional regulator
MTISDSFTLSALIASYERSVVFAESIPNALRVAKAFCEMRWSNGGIVLLGVEEDGQVIGVDEGTIPEIYERFRELCSELTKTRVEIGTLSLGSLDVVFLVFNPIPKNTKPIEDYQPMVHDIVFS